MPVKEVQTLPPAPVEKEYLRVYSCPICPYAERVHLALAAKKVDAEVIWISLQKKPEWYKEIFPKGEVPLLEENGKTLADSGIIFEYLDEKYDSGQKLFPAHLWTKAQIKVFVGEFASKFISNWYKFYRGQATEESKAVLVTYLGKLEGQLKDGRPFFFGQEMTAGDLLVWPWFERLEAAQKSFPAVADLVTKEKFPLVYAWMERMWAQEVVKAAGVTTEAHHRFFESIKGQHDYDVLGHDITMYVKA